MAKKKKKNPAINRLVFIIALLAIITTAGLYYFNRPRFVRYPAFGIDIPESYSIHGIDVSKYQGSIDWNEVKAMKIKDVTINFSFIKATEGVYNEDKRYSRNWKEARKVGMARGAYHFFNPYRSGRQQAQNFIETVALSKGDLPPVLDVEQVGSVSKLQLQERIADWLKLVEMHYKVKPIIYTSADFYSSFLAGKFDVYPLWVAHYLVKDKPRVKRPWHFWQHNEAGHVNGIDAFVDFNVFSGDSTAFKELLIK